MQTLSIDVETFSDVDLTKAGAYTYSASPNFKLLLFAYSVDDSPVQVVDTAQGEAIPEEILTALSDPQVTKWAWNAAFERVVLSNYLKQIGRPPDGAYLDPAGWKCSMVYASALGLPRSLDHCGAALHLEQQKIKAGKTLIRYFCLPTKKKASLTDALTLDITDEHRRLPQNSPEKWEEFKAYCQRDVEVELTIRHKLELIDLPESIWDDYHIDQRINDDGIGVDTVFATRAIEIDTAYREMCMDQARKITGLANPNSPTQLREWFAEQGLVMDALAKKDVVKALETATGDPRTVLELRQELSRSSVKKYQTMVNVATGTPPRAHGLLQYYGAGRTGRWAGRLIQVQNLPRNYLPDLDNARALVRSGDAEMLEMLYPSVPDTLSQLIRTAFIPAPGNRFIVADYSAIEARVLAWLAGETWRLDLFTHNGDIYCQSASKMFSVPVEKHGVNGHLRQKGKIAELACGYGGSVGALKAMGALDMGLDQNELQPIIDAWREANPNITGFWRSVEAAAIKAIETREKVTVGQLTFQFYAGALLIWLPSGRFLTYPGAHIDQNRFGRKAMHFNAMETNGKLLKGETYGGKLVENITQAVARDLLAYAIANIHAAGHLIAAHVHDEVIIDAPPATSLEEIVELMTRVPSWAEGLPLNADGYECDSYRKD